MGQLSNKLLVSLEWPLPPHSHWQTIWCPRLHLDCSWLDAMRTPKKNYLRYVWTNQISVDPLGAWNRGYLQRWSRRSLVRRLAEGHIKSCIFFHFFCYDLNFIFIVFWCFCRGLEWFSWTCQGTGIGVGCLGGMGMRCGGGCGEGGRGWDLLLRCVAVNFTSCYTKGIQVEKHKE